MTTSFEIPHHRHRSPLGDLLATGGSLVHQGQKAPQAAPILLISQDSSLSSTIQEVLSRIQGLKLETVKNHEEASERVAEKEVGLILSHLNPSSNVAGLTRLLGTVKATGQEIPTMVLGEEYHAEQALTLLRRGVPNTSAARSMWGAWAT